MNFNKPLLIIQLFFIVAHSFAQQTIKGTVYDQKSKETLIGALNGVLWSSIVAVAVYLWFDSVFLGGVIAAALMINLIVGAISGVSLPLILEKLDIDPALAGGVILTTITDVVGFVSLLGIATFLM